jgi:hypothetical protein
MPLTSKGKKIMGAMRKQYGSKKGEEVFYASKNKGNIKGVDEMESYKKIGYILAEALGLTESESGKPKQKGSGKPKQKGSEKPKEKGSEKPKEKGSEKPKERRPRYWQWLDDPYKRWWGPGPHPRDRLENKK